MLYPKSDHCNGKTFYNKCNNVEKKFIDVIRWRLTSRRIKWPKHISDNHRPNIVNEVSVSDNQVYITYINHATHLIQLKNINILTDPIFSLRAGPCSFIGPKRIRSPGISFEKLPLIDLVLISHNHFDHFDLPSIRQLIDKFNRQKL
ncbi:MAG: MBL fold metallo-hydrolase [Oligoflexia bacterium]|nr:MBL fold metallo-hydrolase [Oligoflexia bacterium]